MIKETIKNEEEDSNENVDFKTMSILALATSIDALAVGISIACLKEKLLISITSIGIITFSLSILGVKIGNVFGEKYRKISQVLGGIILIIIAIKILLNK